MSYNHASTDLNPMYTTTFESWGVTNHWTTCTNHWTGLDWTEWTGILNFVEVCN